jgi:AbiJ N-terminal domain 4
VTFSKKHGFSSPPPVTFRHDAPRSLRYAVVTAAFAELSYDQIRTAICTTLMVQPDTNNWSPNNIRDEIFGLIQWAEWYRVYDVIEGLASFIEGTLGYDAATGFIDRINEIFVDTGAGWQIKANDGIVIRGDAHFEDSVQNAQEALTDAGFVVAEKELREALHDISRRPTPDLTGAIHHAFGALESVARYVHDSEKSFGEIVKLLDIPKPLDTALEKLWGYSSNYARHVSPTNVPNLNEATLVVHLSSAICRFLVEKKP